jgi:hypothetical protein
MEDTSVDLDTKKCTKCGIDLLLNQIDEHDMRCRYSFNISDFENLIPCELCQELISFEDYENHTRSCRNPYRRLGLNLNISSATDTDSVSDIDNVQSQLNNDPIVRALFNFMVGQPLPFDDSIESEPSITLDSAAANDAAVDAADDAADAAADEATDDAAVDAAADDANNPFIEFLQNLPNPPNNIPNIESFINNIATSIPFDNFNNQMNYEELSNLDDVEVGITNIDNVSELQFSEGDCPICCQNCLLTRKTKCGHIYCDTCLTEWLKTNKKCPTCMIDLE